METYKSLRNQLDSKSKLRLSGYQHNPDMPYSEFIQKLLAEYNKQCPTYDVDTAELQCQSARNRSLEDIYRIVKNYYPNLRLRTIYTTLLENSGSMICSSIKRRTYREKEYWSNHDVTPDEHGWGPSNIPSIE